MKRKASNPKGQNVDVSWKIEQFQDVFGVHVGFGLLTMLTWILRRISQLHGKKLGIPNLLDYKIMTAKPILEPHPMQSKRAG